MEWFQVFLSNTNNSMVSSNYFHLIIIFYVQLYSVQVTDNYPS